jgi:hypothetical protein
MKWFAARPQANKEACCPQCRKAFNLQDIRIIYAKEIKIYEKPVRKNSNSNYR